MKSKSPYLLLTVLTITLALPTYSQQSYELDLEKSIELAREKSNSMQILLQSMKIAEYQLKAATSSFKTHVDMDMILPRYTNEIQQWSDSTGIYYYPVKQNTLNTYVTVRQPLPTDGSLYVRSGLVNVKDYNSEQTNSMITSTIGLQQPVEAFFGYNELKMNYKQVELNYESTKKRLERAELDLVYEVSSLYYNLMAYGERLKIAEMSYEKQLEAYNIANNKFKAGLIREVEALQMEVDLSGASNTLDIAKVNYSAQMRQFNEVIGLDIQDSIIVEGEMDYDEVLIDAEKAVQLALENRNELKEYEIQIELSEMEVKRRKAAGRIQGDIILNYSLFGYDESYLDIPIYSSFQNSWNNISDRGAGNLNAAFSISIPLIDWGENKARVNAAKASMEQNKLQLKGEKISIEREIRNLVEQIQNSLKRLILLEKNVEVAEKSFEISRQRYANGEIDSQAIALERERLNNAYVSRLESYINYKLRLSDLMRKTFYDFENNRKLGE